MNTNSFEGGRKERDTTQGKAKPDEEPIKHISSATKITRCNNKVTKRIQGAEWQGWGPKMVLHKADKADAAAAAAELGQGRHRHKGSTALTLKRNACIQKYK